MKLNLRKKIMRMKIIEKQLILFFPRLILIIKFLPKNMMKRFTQRSLLSL